MIEASIVETALQVALELGLPVFPCAADKRPCIPKDNGGRGFHDATRDPDAIRHLFGQNGARLIGVPTGAASGIDALDLDYRNGARDFETANAHRLPETRAHRTLSGGRHLLFRHAPGVQNSAGRVAAGVDVRGEGGYVIMPPSPGYSVDSEAEIAEWPDWLLPQALPKPTEPRHARDGGDTSAPISDKRLTAFIATVLDRLRQAPEGQKHDALRNAALSLGGIQNDAGFSDADAIQWLLDALPDTVENWKAARETAQWGLDHGRQRPIELEDRPRDNASRSNGHGGGGGREPPYDSPPPTPGNPEEPEQSGRPSIDDLVGFDLTEDGVALAFTAKYKDDLRFCHHRAAWYRWDGFLWRHEETKLAFSWARALCRQLAREGNAGDKLKQTLAKAGTAAAIERFAQSDRAHAVTSAIWDTDPFLLGTPGGTIDLRTGDLREPRQADHITKAAACVPAPSADCPCWLRFLKEACGEDHGLIRFLKQFCGYLLTGDTREHALLFLWGPGGNGKGVFLNTVSNILGDYCTNAAMETFIASSTDKHPTDLAMLRGARMVSASETEEGRGWAEARIKQLTGGDTITARFMRQDFFEFRPEFKLVVVGNHKPSLRNVDNAAKRRFNMVNFLHTPVRPDRELEQKLQAEWPAILRWMIEGGLDWQQHGLVRPKVVLDATEEYFSEQDVLRRWIEERCETGGRNVSATTEALFKDWSIFASANGEQPRTAKWLNGELQRQGFEPVKDTPGHRKKRGFLRISIRHEDTSGQWQNQSDAY